jgi:hypothetical protein
MKSVLTFLLFCCFVANVHSQTLTATEVPAKVREAHKKKYPAAQNAKWKKVNENFEVAHLVNKKQSAVRYDNNGKLISTETETKASEVPKRMTDFLVANFKGQRPTSLHRISDNAGKISYAAEIDHMRYVFDAGGQFLEQLQEGQF